MKTSNRHLSKSSPFAADEKKDWNVHIWLSAVTLIVGMVILATAMGGAAWLTWELLDEKPFDVSGGTIVILGVAFIFGWIVMSINVRGYHSLIGPIVVRFYAWVCLAAVCALYAMTIYKFYLQRLDDSEKFLTYLALLLIGMTALVSLHLIVEKHDLRPYAIPLLLLCMVHLIAIVYRYVFIGNAATYHLVEDLSIFVVMTLISGLMLVHLGVLSTPRDMIAMIFANESKG